LLVESDSVKPLEFVNASRPTVAEVTASETVHDLFVTVGTVYDAVTVDPFNPNEKLFEFENTTADRLFDVVPAETLILLIVAALLCMAVVSHAGC
jgi:hypothetical protein